MFLLKYLPNDSFEELEVNVKNEKLLKMLNISITGESIRTNNKHFQEYI